MEYDRHELFARFVTRFRFLDKSDCWEWENGNRRGGYGGFWTGDRTEGAHRVSWRLFRGNIPKGLGVLHYCDTRRCVNSSHLFLGTNTDNVADMVSKDRQAQGDHHGTHTHPDSFFQPHPSIRKISSEAVSAIRASTDTTYAELAEQFGISQMQVWRIKNYQRRTYE
jgi:hypothetical protein